MATPFMAQSSTVIHRESDDDLSLVASTQTYLVHLASGGTPTNNQHVAWNEFYHSCAPAIRREARDRDGNRTTTHNADAEQDIWLTVVEQLGTFRIDASLGSFPGWLRTVARRRMADRRRVATRRPFPTTWHEPPVHLTGVEVDPAVACEQADERVHLASLLERIHLEVSSLNYRILHLRSIEERPVAEVGRLVGCSPEQVRVRHHRMLKRLRRLAGVAEAEKKSKNSGRRATPERLVTS